MRTAEIYDLAVRMQHGGLFHQFTRLSERLGATITDRKHARIEVQELEAADVDDDAASEAVREWHRRLYAVPDPED